MARYDLYILNSSSAVVAAMPDAVWEISETLNVEDTLRAVLFEADKFTLVTAENTFIQLINPADSTDKRTYRLTSVEQARTDGRHTLKCEGARIWSDMAREIFTLTHPDTGRVTGWHPYRNIPVKTIVAELMGSSAFQIKSGGNAESDTTIIESVELSTTTVLEALQRIAEKADLEIEIDESTSPESIDLKTRGSDNGVRFEYSINSGGMARRFSRAEVVNKIYPVGGGEPPATCEGALFEVSDITTDTITVAGNKCIPSNDTYNTFKIKMVTGDDAGDLFVIGDTVRGSTGDDDTIQLTTTPSDVSAGDLFKFTDASGVELTYVPDAASQTTYGTFDGVVRDTQFEAIRTLITPGYMDGTYASGLHAGWTKVGTPTVAKESGIDYIQHGSASQHITAGSANLGVSKAVALDSSEHYSAAVNLFIVSGSVEVKVTTTGATGGVSYRNQGGTSGTDWTKVELEGIPIEGTTATLTIQSTGGAAEFYIDAVSFTGTQQTREFVRENGARELYRMAFDYLDEHDAPVVEYDLPNALDLFNIDAAQYPFADLSIGDTVNVVDPGMALAASVRVLSLGFDSEGQRLRVKLSSHTSTLAAFSQVAPGVGRVVIENRNDAQAANEHNSNLQGVLDTTARVGRIAPPVARHARFSGSFTAKSQTTFDVGGGDLHMGDSLTYTIAAQTAVSVPSAGDVYYIYFNPSAASSGIQVTTAAATAYTSENIQLGVAVAGATSIDLVQIYDTTGAQIAAEIHTRGVEAYDTGGTKRIDIGVLQDLSIFSNPTDWGVSIADGVLWQENTNAGAYSGNFVGAWRVLNIDHGSNSSADHIVGDWIEIKGRMATAKILRGQNIAVTSNASNLGTTYGSSVVVTHVGSANAYGYYSNVTGGSGTNYSFYGNGTARAYFGGSLEVTGTTTFTGDSVHGGDVRSDTDGEDGLGTTGIRWGRTFTDNLEVTTRIGLGTSTFTNMTSGLAIDQGGADDAIFALKSSDIAGNSGGSTWGITVDEEDTFYSASKLNAAQGGLLERIYCEDANVRVYQIQVYGGQGQTTKSTTGRSQVEYYISDHDGAGSQSAMTADSNLFAVRAFDSSGASATKLIVAEDGDLHVDGSATVGTFDKFEDAKMARALDMVRSPATIIKTKWDEFVNYDRQALVDAGIYGEVSESDLAKGVRPLQNLSQTVRMHNGSIWQLYTQILDMCEKLEDNVPALRGKLLPEAS